MVVGPFYTDHLTKFAQTIIFIKFHIIGFLKAPYEWGNPPKTTPLPHHIIVVFYGKLFSAHHFVYMPPLFKLDFSNVDREKIS